MWGNSFSSHLRQYLGMLTIPLDRTPVTDNSRYFRHMLTIFTSPPFYQKYVWQPSARHPTPRQIRSDSKFFPFFRDAIGAINGCHFLCNPPSRDRGSHRNRKGFTSQNCLFAVSFGLSFHFAYAGWEGSATDARVYEAARQQGFFIPAGKYYLADAGYPMCQELLTPYRSVHYHLAEWGRAHLQCISIRNSSVIYNDLPFPRPANHQELFNLRHMSARNVIERAFGILKKQFRILLLPPTYGMTTQVRIPVALCFLHNFILAHDSEERALPGDDYIPDIGDSGDDSYDDIRPQVPADVDEEVHGAGERRDHIAWKMWEQYQQVHWERGMVHN
jgi:DDE superfamily endonuclease